MSALPHRLLVLAVVAAAAGGARTASAAASSAASGSCAHFHHRSRGTTTGQTICLDAAASDAVFDVSVRLPRGSFSQTIALSLQHYEAGHWITDSTAGLGYEAPVTFDGRHRGHEREPVSESRVSLALDRAQLRSFSDQGFAVRVRGTSHTRGPRHSSASAASARVPVDF
ncbi:MAG: hypothetical protein JWM71_2207 [Solirubrobacteraceae bacterium]|nr:hypothetical protein [Solirubrobacteraceae bacterium]